MADTASTPAADTTKDSTSSTTTDTSKTTPVTASDAKTDTSTTSSTSSTPVSDAVKADTDAAAADQSASQPPEPGDVIQLSDPEVAGDRGPVKVIGEDGAPAIAQPGIDFPHTVEDQHGVGRIVQTLTQDNWVPAAVDPSDADVKAAEERNAREEERADAIKNGRVDPVSGKLLTQSEWDDLQAGNADRQAASRASSDEEAIA